MSPLRMLSRRDLALVVAAGCVAVPVGWGLGSLGGKAPTPHPDASAPPSQSQAAPPQRAEAAPPATSPRQAEALRAAGARPNADATGSVPAPAPGADGALTGVPEVLDTTTLRLAGKVMRLSGVEWARGGKADDLSDYLGGRSVRCEPVGKGDTYRCQADGQDLSRVVLYNGGGRAAFDAPPEFKAAEQRARSEHLGVWASPGP